MNPFTQQNQEQIARWIFGILDDLPTEGQVGIGIDTNGNSVEIAEYVGSADEVEIGTFDEGWLTQPAESAACPNCSGEHPALVHAHMESETLVHDCLNCRTRVIPGG